MNPCIKELLGKKLVKQEENEHFDNGTLYCPICGHRKSRNNEYCFECERYRAIMEKARKDQKRFEAFGIRWM